MISPIVLFHSSSPKVGSSVFGMVQLYAVFIFYFIYLFIHSFIHLFLAALGLHFCAWAFSSCSEQGLLFIAVRVLLIVVASVVAEHRL